MAKRSSIDEFIEELGLKTETQSQSKSQIRRRRRNKVNGVETNNGANLGFEAKLWEAANKLRGHLDAAEYKHVVLGLIFLKYLSDAFQEVYEELKKEPYADPEDRDEYTARNVFYVPKEARWSYIRERAKQPERRSF